MSLHHSYYLQQLGIQCWQLRPLASEPVIRLLYNGQPIGILQLDLPITKVQKEAKRQLLLTNILSTIQLSYDLQNTPLKETHTEKLQILLKMGEVASPEFLLESAHVIELPSLDQMLAAPLMKCQVWSQLSSWLKVVKCNE